jgi:molybdate transport system substrate-binding protein
MKKNLFVLVSLLLFLSACASAPQNSNRSPNAANDLTVSAAVSLKEAFTEIGQLYTAQTGEKVNFNFGASGALEKQIESGAPADVFASAGEQQMDQLNERSLVDKDSRRDFARNTLQLIVPADSKLKLGSFSDLTKPDVKKIAAGDPKSVPAGQYANEVFRNLNIQQALQPKLVMAEDVRQVLDYVSRGEADAGVVYATDALSAGDKIKVIAAAPNGSHSPILYPIAAVHDTKQKAAAQKFIDLVMSKEGQDILVKHGFAER